MAAGSQAVKETHHIAHSTTIKIILNARRRYVFNVHKNSGMPPLTFFLLNIMLFSLKTHTKILAKQCAL